MNDNHLEYDEHLALGQGEIDWQQMFRLFGQYGLMDRSMLLEVSGLKRAQMSLEYMRKFIKEE